MRHNPSGLFYIHARLRDPQSDLLVAQIALLRDVVRLCRKRAPFVIDAAVVLPAQLQMIWRLPDGDTDVGNRWRMIRSGFARHVPLEHVGGSGRTVWQRLIQTHAIRDTDDLALHRHLIATARLRGSQARWPDVWPPVAACCTTSGRIGTDRATDDRDPGSERLLSAFLAEHVPTGQRQRNGGHDGDIQALQFHQQDTDEHTQHGIGDKGEGAVKHGSNLR